MSIVLHFLPGSPFSWRPLLALGHKGIPFDARRVKPSEGELRSDAFLALNPRGKIPVLQDGDFTLYESVPILEYLDDRFPDAPRLYPEQPAERARVRRLICEMDNYWWPGAASIADDLYFNSDRASWNLETIEKGKATVTRELSFLEGQLRGDTFTGELGAADYCLYPFLAHLARYDLRKPDLGLDGAIGPGLRGLMTRIEEQPFFEATYPAHWRG